MELPLGLSMKKGLDIMYVLIVQTPKNEPRHEKTDFLHMRKQRGRSAA